jgi:hypothetical protein
MNSKQKGDRALAKAIAYFMEQDCEVLLPIGDKRPYDLVTEMSDGSLKKVQCKFTSHKNKNGFYAVPLRVMGGNRSSGSNSKKYTKEDFDILFALTADGEAYAIPFIEVNATSELSLGKLCEKWMIRPIK